MRVQFVSDLHLEFPASGGTLALENVEGRTDLLVLAGDICTAKKAARGEFEPFFRHCAETFPQGTGRRNDRALQPSGLCYDGRESRRESGL